MGYRRLGGALEGALLTGFQYARTNNEIATDSNGYYVLINGSKE